MQGTAVIKNEHMAHATLLKCWTVHWGDNSHLTTFRSLKNINPSLGKLPWTLTSSTVSSCGVAALSSESFWEPASALLRTSLLFLCLWASFLTCPSAFPLLRRLTGLVSHFLRVLPGRLGPGELCAPIMWGWSDVTEAGGLASLLETERESGRRMRGAFKSWNTARWETRKMTHVIMDIRLDLWMNRPHYFEVNWPLMTPQPSVCMLYLATHT